MDEKPTNDSLVERFVEIFLSSYCSGEAVPLSQFAQIIYKLKAYKCTNNEVGI